VLELLKGIAMEIRTSEKFSSLFVADPQILGVDAIKGSELIFPVVFKTLATKQYAPVREFRRRVRLSLEENHLLPGDPNRVFNTFMETTASKRSRSNQEVTTVRDPTTLKPQEGNPFSG
jgi:small conductance mechanosensitive channel